MTETKHIVSPSRRAVANLATLVAIQLAIAATIALGVTLSSDTDPHRYMTHAAIAAIFADAAFVAVTGLLILARWARTAGNAAHS